MAFTMNPPELPQVGDQPVVLDIGMFSTGLAKQPVLLRWSRRRERSKKLPGALWACETCVLRAKISGFKKIDLNGEKPPAFLQSSF